MCMAATGWAACGAARRIAAQNSPESRHGTGPLRHNCTSTHPHRSGRFVGKGTGRADLEDVRAVELDSVVDSYNISIRKEYIYCIIHDCILLIKNLNTLML